MMGFALFCTGSALCIKPEDAIAAQPSKEEEAEKKKGQLKEVMSNKAFLMFLLLTGVFYLSNGAMLPLVAQEIARADAKNSTMYLAACIIIAQAVMVPTVWACGKLAGKGRKKLLAVAFVLLAIRGVAYMVTDSIPYFLFLQVLDGMAAGTYSVVAIMVVNDLMGESDLASFAQGLLVAALSLGSMLSNLLGGFVVDFAGFPTGFLVLSAMALASLVLLWKGMPETAKAHDDKAKTAPPLQDFTR
jgi:MFS family permease